jgi:hypothetical protein
MRQFASLPRAGGQELHSALLIKYQTSKLSVFLQLMIFGMLGRRAPVSS